LLDRQILACFNSKFCLLFGLCWPQWGISLLPHRWLDPTFGQALAERLMGRVSRETAVGADLDADKAIRQWAKMQVIT
jgi:hypothetical protein